MLEKAYLAKLAARLCGASEERAELLGLGGELAMFSALTVDDWVDSSSIRASRPAIHARHGPPLTVFAANCLLEFAHAAVRDACDGLPVEVQRAIQHSFSDAVLSIQAGQALVEQFDPTSGTYAVLEKMARLRCGRLIAFAMGAAGWLVGREDLVRALNEAGEWVGIALQHRNDIQDFTVAYDQTIKPPMADLLKGQPNLVVTAIDRNSKCLSKSQRELLAAVRGRATGTAIPELTREEFEGLLAIVEATGAGYEALDRLALCAQRATRCLAAGFPAEPLEEWLDYADALTLP